MSDERRKSDALLLAGAIIVWAGVMCLHPDHALAPPLLWRFSLSDLVHGTALLLKPVLLLGFWRLSQHLGVDRTLVGLAFCFYLLGDIAMMCAGVVSGWITPEVVAAFRSSSGSEQAAFGQIGRFSVWINRGFAQTNVSLVSIAYLLWALAWPGGTLPGLLIRGFGIAAGGFGLAWQMSGSFEPSPFNMMILVATQSLWVVAAAAGMGWLTLKQGAKSNV